MNPQMGHETKIGRRSFLGSAVAGTAGSLLLGRFSFAAPASPASTDPTALVPLGKHLRVSRIGMGFGMKAYNRVSNLTRRGREHTENLIRYAYDQGIRFYDSADLYGSHEYIARALSDKPRESYVLSSKVWFHPKGLPEPERQDADVAVKRFLKELNTEYLDLVQLHCMMKPNWPQEMRKQMDLLEGLKEKGLIRAHGVSCHSIPALEAAAQDPWVDVIHTRINPFGVKMDGTPAQVVPVIKRVHDAGKGVIGMKIIGEGAFRDDPQKRDESVRFVFGLGCVDMVIVGFEVSEEIDEFKTRVKQALTA
jgi:aryl-alcohol dehydrogenase-like predicted oxidoreductase